MEDSSFVLFVDNSGSVAGSKNYWSTVQQVITQYSKDISNYYLWNSDCKQCSLKQMENSINIMQGLGGTSPQNVALEIVAMKFKRVILMTDGQVGNYSVQKCDQIFQKGAENNFKLSKSICYIISNANKQVDMSVTCPFTRYCDSQIFTKHKQSPLKAVVHFTSEDFKILDTLQQITLQTFEDKYSLIEGLIIALNMGKAGNIPLKNQLVNMKNRLVKELSKRMTKECNFSKEIKGYLENGNFDGAIKIASIMTEQYFSQNLTMTLQKKISYLINLCGDLRGHYDINQIKSNKMATAVIAKKGQIDLSVQIQALSKNLIECPIIMDEDVPQILVDQCPSFFLGVEKYVVDDIAACPLRILNYPDLRAKFKASLSTYTGVKLTDKLLKNPFTQNRLIGAIPLGTHPSHIEVGNYTLARLLTGGKILGNLNLYYAVVWYLINEGEIEYLKPIRNNASQHLIYRLVTSKTTASLCGLAQFVTTELSTDVAIWYCVSSGYLNQPANRDTFRFHYYNMEPMIKIIELLGYPIHQGTLGHLNRTKNLMRMLSRFKKMTSNERATFKNLFKGLFQNGVFLDQQLRLGLSQKFKSLETISDFIPIDGQASKEQTDRIKYLLPKCCDQISNQEAYFISTLLDSQLSASDIFLDYNIKIPPLPKPQINWCYGLKDHDVSNMKFNPRTLRPYYTISKYQNWEDQAKQTFKVSKVEELFAGSKYLIAYVLKYKKQPLFVELLQFYYNRYVEAGKMSTLPYLIVPWTHYLIKQFNEATKGESIDSIIETLTSSVKVNSRIFMESFTAQQ